MKTNKIIFVAVIISALLLQNCAKPTAKESVKGATQAIVPDLSTPPPGSNATQEKWNSFDDAKKEGAWDKYVTENSSTAEKTTAKEAPVEEVKKGRGGGGGSSVVAVEVAKLSKSPLNLYYYGLGELQAGHELHVTPASNGTVVSLYVSIGDFVEPGDLLFSLDGGDLVKSIERASEKWDKDLELARIRLSESLESYETSDSLYSKELISKAEYDKAKQSWQESELNYEKIQLSKTAEIENLQDNLSTTVAISPSRGYISDMTFTKNESVNSGDYVEIIDIEKIEVAIQVPENVITRVKKGLIVIAKQASSPDYLLEGVITSVGLKSNSNRAFEVTAEFDNRNQKLLPGMLMEAQIKLVQTNVHLIVPKESVINEGANHFIYTVKDNVAVKVPVETGNSRGKFIQISGSVDKGDLFVITGQSYLQKGTTVKVIGTKEYMPTGSMFQ